MIGTPTTPKRNPVRHTHRHHVSLPITSRTISATSQPIVPTMMTGTAFVRSGGGVRNAGTPVRLTAGERPQSRHAAWCRFVRAASATGLHQGEPAECVVAPGEVGPTPVVVLGVRDQALRVASVAGAWPAELGDEDRMTLARAHPVAEEVRTAVPLRRLAD